MTEYLLASIFIHGALLLGLYFSPEVNTSGGADKIAVEIIEKKKMDQKPFILPSPTKPLIPGKDGAKAEKHEQIDIKDYGDQLKVLVDPVWVSNLEPYKAQLTKTYEIIVLLSVDKYGKITNITIQKGSGVRKLDQLAINTFREIGSVPKPPEVVVKDGIEWTLTF